MFQEHDSARVEGAPLPPLHARLREMMWRMIAHEGGDLHMGLNLVPALRDAGFTIEGLQVEASMFIPEQDNLIAKMVPMMMPRLVAAGVATAHDFDPDQLERQLADESAASGVPLLWETIFGAWAIAS